MVREVGFYSVLTIGLSENAASDFNIIIVWHSLSFLQLVLSLLLQFQQSGE